MEEEEEGRRDGGGEGVEEEEEEEEEEEDWKEDEEEEEEEEKKDEVSVGVIMTNTEIFHIYHIILPFYYSTCLFSIFSISFHNFLLYFPNLFTIQLIFLS